MQEPAWPIHARHFLLPRKHSARASHSPKSQIKVLNQAAQDRQARGVKRSADVILKDEEERYHHRQQGVGQQLTASGLTESYTADGNDDGPLADEDDMEEEIVGESGRIWMV